LLESESSAFDEEELRIEPIVLVSDGESIEPVAVIDSVEDRFTGEYGERSDGDAAPDRQLLEPGGVKGESSQGEGGRHQGDDALSAQPRRTEGEAACQAIQQLRLRPNGFVASCGVYAIDAQEHECCRWNFRIQHRCNLDLHWQEYPDDGCDCRRGMPKHLRRE